jgi:flavodoxin
MNTLVVYESQFGNTKKLAELIGKAFEPKGPVRVVGVGSFEPSLTTGIDLLIVGGPTQAHAITPVMREFLDRLEARPAGIPAAAFDTRIKGPVFLWGSAARDIAAKLRGAGFTLIAPPESFLVTLAKQAELYNGETERAVRWACEVRARLEAGQLMVV